MKALISVLIAYCAMSLLIFGDPITPLFLLTLWASRFGIPFWQILVAISVFLAAGIFRLPKRYLLRFDYRPPAFVVLGMTLSILSVGLIADKNRNEKLAAFRADKSFNHSFIRSLGQAPAEFQTYLHAAALRDCVPYAWSYRKMDFYRLPSRAAVNVLPPSWIKPCSIQPD